MEVKIIGDNLIVEAFGLAGVGGIAVNSPEEATRALDSVLLEEDIGLVMITRGVASMVRDRVNEIKMRASIPLIVEVPDRSGTPVEADETMRLLREVIGIKVEI